jgi:hypothetical protein
MKKSGFPVRTPAFCSVSRGPSRLGEKECRAPSMTPGVALRPRTQDPRAARRNHHAHERGLVQHLLDKWRRWEPLKPRAIALTTPNLANKCLDLDTRSLRGDPSHRTSERASRATGARAQSSATSAFEASVQQPAASAQVEPRDSRAAPQPNGRGVSVAARFPSLNELLRALAFLRALEGTRPMPIGRSAPVSTQAADSLRLCRCVGFLGQATP